MLMPIQFPRDLMITNFIEVEEMDLVPRLERHSFPVDHVQGPINFSSIVEVAVAEQAKLMLQDFVRLFNSIRDGRRQVPLEQFYSRIKLLGGKEEIAHFRRLLRQPILIGE